MRFAGFWTGASLGLGSFIAAAVAQEPGLGRPVEWQIGLQKAATPVMENIRWFHNLLLLPIITLITLFVLGLLVVTRAQDEQVPIGRADKADAGALRPTRGGTVLGDERAAQAVDRVAADRLISTEILAAEGPLTFVHPLLRRAVYEGILPATRADSHRRAGLLLAEEGPRSTLAGAHLLRVQRYLQQHGQWSEAWEHQILAECTAEVEQAKSERGMRDGPEALAARSAVLPGNDKVARTYDRHDYEVEVREALDQWGVALRVITGAGPPETTNIIQLHA